MTSRPDLEVATAYLTSLGVQEAPEDVEQALDAETAAQAAVCRVPGDPEVWPADLAEALLRRVNRNLAMRKVPFGLQAATTEVGAAFARIGSDPEIRRLEAPHRRLVVG